MKGLLYKEAVTNKGNIFALAFVVYYLSVVLSVFSSEAVENDEGSGTVITMLLGCIFALNFAFPLIAFESGFADVKARWNGYAMALPGGYKRVVLAKYLLGIIGHVLAVGISFILIFRYREIFCFEPDMFIMFILLLTGIVLFVEALLMPFVLKGKVGVVQIIFLGSMILAVYGILAYVALGDISFFKQDNLMLRVITWIANNERKLWGICWSVAGAGVVLEVLSYIFTVRTYLKD